MSSSIFTGKEKTKTMRYVFEGMSDPKKEVAYWMIGKATEKSFIPPVMAPSDKAVWETFTEDEKNVVYAILADVTKPAWKPLTSSDLALFADFAADIHRKKEHNEMKLPEVKNVYFNCPVTVVMWKDGTKTIVRCSENDTYDPEKGLAMAIIKKVSGNDNSFHKIFKKWIPED